MSDTVKPTIDVIITPNFDSAQQVESLSIFLSIGPLHLKSGDTLVSYPLNLRRHTSVSSRRGIWEAFDDLGNLPVYFANETPSTSEEWLVQRNTSGRINLSYNATPALSKTPVSQGIATDLRYDHGGLIGSGFSFIPIPPGDKIHHLTVKWDLNGAPEGTRAIWSFGEGPGLIRRTGSASVLRDSVYMVGPIRSHPPAPIPGTISDYYGYYWFGGLPPNLEIIKDIHHDFFLKVSEFFNDTPSASNPYRHFVRETTPVKSFGGTSFTRSHIFDYDDRIDQVQDYDLIRRMAYEIVHNYLGPSVTDPNIDWLFEGIKNTLSIYLPFRPPNQFRTGHYFQSTINMLCMKYYTNPYLHLPQDKLLILASKDDAYAVELVSARAWAFVLGTDFAARKLAAKTKPPQRPIENLAIKALAFRKREGKAHGIEDWIEFLTPLMGKDVRKRYEYMLSGKVILLPEEVFGAKSHRLIRIDQEKFDIGMDRLAFEGGLVRGLKEGSRAEKAGLREGDRISWNSHTFRCAEDFEAELEVAVDKDGKDEKVKFWPRAFEKAESWQMVKVEDT